MSTISPVNQAEILRRALSPPTAGLSLESLSRVDFAPEDQEQMRELAAKAREGSLAEEERAVLSHYEVVNDLLGILRSKARISLKQADSTGV
ncbi:MAG: hypothetical protein KY475_25935 [Planctomycetes bacterium]|nr:hypothetical protein [Planctomycetota bacterium]